MPAAGPHQIHQRSAGGSCHCREQGASSCSLRGGPRNASGGYRSMCRACPFGVGLPTTKKGLRLNLSLDLSTVEWRRHESSGFQLSCRRHTEQLRLDARLHDLRALQEEASRFCTEREREGCERKRESERQEGWPSQRGILPCSQNPRVKPGWYKILNQSN